MFVTKHPVVLGFVRNSQRKEGLMAKITTSNGRYYEWNGEKYPSVTTILSKGIPKPGLIKWSARLVAEHAVHDETWLDMDNQQAYEYLSSRPDVRRNSSANLGSAIHSAAEAYSLGNEPTNVVSPEAQEYLNGFTQFLSDYRPSYLFTEAAVFNRTHRYAGTLDSIVRIGRTVWVLDTKTGNRVYPEVALQLSAYANAEFLGREGGEQLDLPKIKKGGVLHLRPNGYDLIPVRIDEEVFDSFLAVKDVFHWDFELSKVVLREPLEKVAK
jgi:hypothetical protein